MPAVSGQLAGLVFEFGGACQGGMDAVPPSNKCEKAIKQSTALLFNLESGKLQGVCEVDLAAEGCTSTDVGSLMDELAGLINSGDPSNCQLAADCAGAVNEGTALLEGLSLTSEPASMIVETDRAAPQTSQPVPSADPATQSVTRSSTVQEPAGIHLPANATPIVPDTSVVESADTPEAETEEALLEVEDGLKAIHRHLAVLSNPSAPEAALSVSRDALLNALSGGYEPEVRIEIVQGLFLRIDESLVSLLVEHLLDIRDEARDFDREELVNEAERLLKRLDVPEK
jgi:hypothetical protein